MGTIWLPFDEWAEHLEPPPGHPVAVWRDGLPFPTDPAEVVFYVPEYLGPASVVEVLDHLPALRVLQTLTAGYDHLVDRVPPGATLCNARGVHEASTAELAVGLIIGGLRGFSGFVRAQDQGVWLHARHDALADQTVVVVGAGAVGRAVVARLEPFETNVVIVARTARTGMHGIDALPSILPTADVVVMVVPFNDSTHGMVDAQFLSLMKDGALLVNIARGPVVVTADLLTELNAGRLRAALDVTDPEPLPVDHPLWSAPNVFITPHVGGDTSAFMPRAWKLLHEQLRRYVAHEPLLNVIETPMSPT